MATVLLTVGLTALSGIALFLYRRGPRVGSAFPLTAPNFSLAEMAVLRDGAMGATRWAFAALVVKLARDGHCTLVRTRKRRWVSTGPALTVDLHADPRALSALEQTVLRQLGRHDTLGGFGFAGSTFRRRTLRDVRNDLIERGWLADRRRPSNALLGLGLVLAGAGLAAAFQDWGSIATSALFGGALASGTGALPRHPLTEAGARQRTAHRAYAEQQRDRVRSSLPGRPDQAWTRLVEALPHLVLERIATPRWLITMAGRFEPTEAHVEAPAPDWIQNEVDGHSSAADACWTLARVLRALGARTPFLDRPNPL